MVANSTPVRMASQVQKDRCLFCSHESKLMLRMKRRFHKEFSRESTTNVSLYKGYKLFSEVLAYVRGKASASDQSLMLWNEVRWACVLCPRK